MAIKHFRFYDRTTTRRVAANNVVAPDSYDGSYNLDLVCVWWIFEFIL